MAEEILAHSSSMVFAIEFAKKQVILLAKIISFREAY